MPGRLDAITPIVPVRDEATSIAFYSDALGFELKFHAPENRYALLARDKASVILLGGADDAALTATRNNISAYIWVDGLDAAWSKLEAKLGDLPAGRVRPPFVQDYGMREFHVKDPDGFLIFFGEHVEREGEH